MDKPAAIAVLLFAAPLLAAEPVKEKVDFSRDVRTILAGRCFTCHGPDDSARKAGLRLDLRDSATRPLKKTGHTPIVPGDVSRSALVERIFSHDTDEMMPPPETKKPLTEQEKETLKKWVEQGAEYSMHWSFIPPQRSKLPAVKNTAWARNEIDRFILARLEKQKLTPSPEADRYTLVRRLYMDLTGLPPTEDEVDQFIGDASPNAYERLVDRALNSPRFGEKIGLAWLDLARFGDTNGYHYDSTRYMWLWRNYVIDSYNHDKPFDAFTVEQLGGDLLPGATTEQLVASGFNRNTRFNEEGGADPEEFAVTYAKDRVLTLGQVWLGLTTGCAECHSHKYDPISQHEYYQLYAFFNSIQEPMASGNHGAILEPVIKVATEAQKKTMGDAEGKIAAVRKQIAAEVAKVTYTEPAATETPAPQGPVDFAWIDDDAPSGAKLQGDGQNPPWQWVGSSEVPVFKGLRATKRTGAGLNQHYFTDVAKPLVMHEGDKLFAYVYLDPKNPPKTVQLQFHSTTKTWAHRAYWGENLGHASNLSGPANHKAGELPELGKWVRLEVEAKTVGLDPGTLVSGWAFTQHGGTVYYDYAGVNTSQPPSDKHLKSLRAWEQIAAADNGVPQHLRDAIKVEETKRTPEQQKSLRDYYVQNVYADTRQVFDALNNQVKGLEETITQTQAAMPSTMVSREMEKTREAFVLVRGDFLQKGDKVERNVPAVFPPMKPDMPKNRLGLAQWLTSADHPLTSRVAVNRLWYQMFGTGLVKTLGDLGFQGELPSHADLLDWLATEYVREGWSTKAMLRKIALSATYRQSSSFLNKMAQDDPYNRLLYRGPRYRIAAEEVRDNALAIAGLLSTRVGGPSVMPYQPADFYKGKNENWPWNVEKGEDLYRRGMYTFWRRTSLHPTFAIFDAPSREECAVERPRTNTPLQALTTLNDPMYVEAARVLAQSLLTDGPAEPAQRAEKLFRRVMVRKPSEVEVKVVAEIYQQQLAIFKADPSGAQQLSSSGHYRRPANLDPIEHAAWTAVSNVLLNTDEAITRE